jgi:hypothetical protein
VLISADRSLGDGEADRGLANATRPDNRDQAPTRELRNKRCHDVLATNHPSCRERQIVPRRPRGCRGQGGPWQRISAYRRDEIVALSYSGGDVTIVALSVAEGTTQSVDLDLQIRFFDERRWPGSGNQFLLADHLARTFDQSGQDIEGAAAQSHWLVAVQQEPPRCDEPVRAKGDRVSIHRADPRYTNFYQTFPNRCQRGPGAVH